MKTTEVTEMCPHCQNEVTVQWNVEKDGYELYCPYCGFPVMLCSMCDARDGKVCDWEEIKGCKHSDERYRDYFYKNLSCENAAEIARSSRDNDGWIPVDERVPKERVRPICLDFDDYLVTINFGFGARVKTLKYGDGHWWNGPSIVDEYVIAWRTNPEPYHPERSNDEKE